MARLPVSEEELDRHATARTSTKRRPGGWDQGLEVDRVVNTHCCFCGQQCGIKLKVRDNAVVGFEPWYEFPFNEGKLCPKGVKRYLQGSHPDRLLAPDGARPGRAGWVPGRSVGTPPSIASSAEIRRIQAAYGDDAFAMLSGVSLTNEKSYLIGKFARLALHTANLDYNGRFCMVSAGAGNKKALGIDRNANPWSDIPLADVVWVAGSNVAETFPITTSYIWRARDRGARLIVQDPRVVPLARTADLFLPVRPGTDSALFGAVLHELIQHDWLDHEFIDAHTNGFDDAAAAVADMTPKWAAEVTGVPAARIEQAAEWWGTSATGMLLHARGIEQQSKGTENVLAAINLGLATGKYGKPGCGVTTITGQGNGQGGREHGHKCDQLPGNRDITNPEHRAHVAAVWGCDEAEIPGKGITAQEIIEAIHAGQIKGLLSICFNPAVSAPDTRLTAEALDRLEFYAVIDFFLSEIRAPRRRRAARVAARGGRGHGHDRRGPHREDQQGRRPARRGAGGLADPRRHRAAGSARASTSRTRTPSRSSRSCASPRPAAPPTTAAPRGSASRTRWACSGRSPRRAIPGTPRLFEGGRFYHPDGKARFHGVPYREPAEVVDDEYPIWLTTGRVVSQYLSGTQTRRIGGLVEQYPAPLCEMHPQLAASAAASATATS